MKKIIMGSIVVAMFAVPTFVMAQDTASGTLAVTGTVVSSIELTIDSAGGTFSGPGVATTTDLGNISKFGGVVPTGFTRSTTSSDWTLTSAIGVTVTKANSASTAYTLNAKLASAPAGGVAWTVNGFTLNAATVTAMTAAGVWGSTPTYPWTITIPDALATATAIDNTIEFSAISG
jgi:hypothetical protein